MIGLGYSRLYHQRIAGEQLDSPTQVVRWMGALQAQDYGQAVWAVGLRTRAPALAQVLDAIEQRKILRTWPMRGTLHFVAAEDARWMVRLSSARVLASGRRRRDQLGLDEATLRHAMQQFETALADEQRLTRSAMMDLLEKAGIAVSGQRGYHLLVYAALNGLICLGPMQDRQQTFVLLEDWAPRARDLPRAEALAELARRYFTSHGPASLRDFAWWSGLTLRDARAALAEANDGWKHDTIDGIEYWWSDEHLQPIKPDPSAAYLLPGFDEYLLGYAQRGAVLADPHTAKITPGKNGMFRALLVVGDQVTGVWKRSIRKDVTITFEPFEPLSIPPESLHAAAQRYATFLQKPFSLAGDEVTS